MVYLKVVERSNCTNDISFAGRSYVTRDNVKESRYNVAAGNRDLGGISTADSLLVIISTLTIGLSKSKQFPYPPKLQQLLNRVHVAVTVLL